MNRKSVDREKKSFSGLRERSFVRSAQETATFASIDPHLYFDQWLQAFETSTAKRSSEFARAAPGAKITFDGTMKLSGYVRANVQAPQGVLIVTAAAVIEGDIWTERAIVHGVVRGDITAQSVDLGNTAEVIGHIHAAALSVAEGAVTIS